MLTLLNTARSIGIWGFGIVGKSLLKYLTPHNYRLGLLDKRQLSQEEQEYLATHTVSFFDQSRLEEFLSSHDIIIPSPGIDVRLYHTYAHKFISEVDIFFDALRTMPIKPQVIGITGTLGKTTITYLLTTILQNNHKKAAALGNIGTAMLDACPTLSELDVAVIELSSFQLEHAHAVAPDLAIWTNLYPKHLDRHDTLEEYFNAKYSLIKNQSATQQALVPWELAEKIYSYNPRIQLNFFSEQFPENYTQLKPTHALYYYDAQGQCVKYLDGLHTPLILPARQSSKSDGWEPVEGCSGVLNNAFNLTYPINWLIITAALDCLGYTTISLHPETLHLPEHRLELVAIVNNIHFYNDSKSTMMVATQAAVDKLRNQNHHKKIILLLGGVSDGGDRRPHSSTKTIASTEILETLEQLKKAQKESYNQLDNITSKQQTFYQKKLSNEVVVSHTINN